MSNNNSQGRWEFDENGNVHYVESPSQTDGSYHYSYRSPSQPERPTRGSAKKRANDDAWHWIFIVLGFMVAAPIGVILLLLELSGKWPGSKDVSKEVNRVVNAVQNGARKASQAARSRSAQPGNYGQTTGDVMDRLERERAEREAQQKAAAKSSKSKKTSRKKKTAVDEGLPYGLGYVKAFRIAGGIIAGLFGFTFVMTLIDEITYFYSLRYLLGETLPLLAFTLIGVALIAMAGSRKRKLKKFQRYLTMIGKRDHISITSLSEAMGVSERAAEKDLEEMLERDFWPEGYVDAARKMLVLGSPLEDTPAPEVDQEIPAEDDNAAATLRHIRTVNDAIADENMSRQIDHIEELTAKIFKLLEEKPERASELRTFMNYYLPQTLKILERYSELEAQGVDGENIATAKAQIEGMMDKLVEGYETQLDKLFENDALDISADIKVMEQMLEKDGLAMENELKF